MKKILKNRMIDFLVAFAPVIGGGLESQINTAMAYESPIVQESRQKPAPAPKPAQAPASISEDLKRDGYDRGNKKESKIERPKYHPSIEDYERQLEREISQLVPTYYEFNVGFDNPEKSLLKERFNKIRENPKIVQNNKHYHEFTKHLKSHYDNKEIKGFLGLGLSLSELSETVDGGNDLKKELGFSINLNNPKENDKAVLFLIWLQSQKDRTINKNDGELFYRVLDDIAKSGKMPTRDYKSKEFAHLESRPYSADYESDVDVKREKRTIEEFGGILGVVNSAIWGGVEPVITDYIDEELVNKWSGPIGNNELMNLPPFPKLLSSSFYLNENKKINLGMFFPDRVKKEKIKNAGIELYNPRGEKIKSWNFKVYEPLEVENFDLEKIVRKNGFGTYNSAFFINDKCWNVRQFEVGY